MKATVFIPTFAQRREREFALQRERSRRLTEDPWIDPDAVLSGSGDSAHARPNGAVPKATSDDVLKAQRRQAIAEINAEQELPVLTCPHCQKQFLIEGDDIPARMPCHESIPVDIRNLRYSPAAARRLRERTEALLRRRRGPVFGEPTL